VRPGFYPAGGGQAIYEITPCATLTPLELRTRGEIVETRARARVAQLSPKIGEREINTLCDELGWDRAVAKVERVKKSSGPGNVLLVEVKSDALCEVFVGFGEKGVPAEQVARDVAAEVKQYLAADVPVGQHLADQLLLWIALCGQGSFVTLPPMQHTMTQRDVIKAFIDVDIRCQQLADGRFQLNVSPEEN
jgi:RNA 3'-terminal phosphate cyclase (ATP)